MTEPDLAALRARLDEIRARADAATPGPWRVGRPFWRCILEHGRGSGGHGQGDCRYTFGGWMDESEPDAPAEIYQDGDFVEDQTEQGVERKVAGTVGYEGGGVCWPADAAFIAHAREDVPALLSLVARLQGERERTKETLRVIEDLGRKLARPELDPSTRLLLAERVVDAARAALGEEGT